MPMQPEAEMSEAPEMGEEMEVSDGSYTIELTVHPDGSIDVATESADTEAAEEGMEPEPATYGSPKEALTAVLEIIKGSSQSSVMPKGMEKAQMSAGFNEGKML